MNQPFCFLLLCYAQNKTLRKPAYTFVAFERYLLDAALENIRRYNDLPDHTRCSYNYCKDLA